MRLTTLLFLGVVVGVVYSQGFCGVCEQLVQTLEKELEQDEPDIDKAVDNFCKELTDNNPAMTQVCDKFLDDEVDKIIKGIEANDPPDVICKDIGFC